jgi:hypothetical protein
MTDELAQIRARLVEGYAAPRGDYPGPYQAVHDVSRLVGIIDALRSRREHAGQ